jgi:methylated-DNA-[protein]-cysteine S-methyltransferase
MNELKRLAPRKTAERASRDAAAALADGAVREGLLDVALGLMDSPIGELMVAVTPKGLVCVAFDDDYRERVLERIGREISPRILSSSRATDAARTELEEYFAGGRRRFDLTLDRRLMSPFVRKVLSATERVGFGETSTYGRIASTLGRPTASRAVGAALGSNPIPIVVPCHRIVGGGGKLTGYAGGLDRKVTLLRLEGSLPPALTI